jgi:hypothetical protein
MTQPALRRVVRLYYVRHATILREVSGFDRQELPDSG